MVDYFESRNETETHAKPQQTPSVGHESDNGNLLIPLEPSHHGILDVDVDQGHVLFGIPENLCLDNVSDFGRVQFRMIDFRTPKSVRTYEIRSFFRQISRVIWNDHSLVRFQKIQMMADGWEPIGQRSDFHRGASFQEFFNHQTEFFTPMECLWIGECWARFRHQIDLIFTCCQTPTSIVSVESNL